MSAVVSDPIHLAGRGVRALLRQPWFVAITLVQPVVWLLLFSPVRRGSVMTGSLLNQQVTTVVQTLVILALGFATGARFPGGVGIMLVFVASVILLAAAFASYSNGLALLLRSQESVIGAVNFVVLPLSFLSSMLVPTDALPGWIAAIARWN